SVWPALLRLRLPRLRSGTAATVALRICGSFMRGVLAHPVTERVSAPATRATMKRSCSGMLFSFLHFPAEHCRTTRPVGNLSCQLATRRVDILSARAPQGGNDPGIVDDLLEPLDH